MPSERHGNTPIRNTLLKIMVRAKPLGAEILQAFKEEAEAAIDLIVRERQGRLEAERRASKLESQLESFCDAKHDRMLVLCVLHRKHEGLHAAIIRGETGSREILEWGGSSE